MLTIYRRHLKACEHRVKACFMDKRFANRSKCEIGNAPKERFESGKQRAFPSKRSPAS